MLDAKNKYNNEKYSKWRKGYSIEMSNFQNSFSNLSNHDDIINFKNHANTFRCQTNCTCVHKQRL